VEAKTKMKMSTYRNASSSSHHKEAEESDDSNGDKKMSATDCNMYENSISSTIPATASSANMDDVDRQALIEATDKDHIRNRNAMYSKRKYYKKKRFIESLKTTKLQLQSDNRALRQSNTQLEAMIERAKKMIAENKLIATAHAPTLNAMQPPETLHNHYHGSTTPSTSSSMLSQMLTSSSTTTSYPSSAQNDQHPMVSSSTASSMLSSFPSTLSQPVTMDRSILRGNALNTIHDNFRSNTNSAYLQQLFSSTSTTPTSVNHGIDPTLLLPTTERPITAFLSSVRNNQYEALLRRNTNQMTPSMQSESSVLSLLLQQERANRSLANIAGGGVPNAFSAGSDIGLYPSQIPTNDTSINAAMQSLFQQQNRSLTVPELLLLQRHREQQRLTLGANAAATTIAAAQNPSNNNSSNDEHPLLQYYLSRSRDR
jgi:hypothetical protein